MLAILRRQTIVERLASAPQLEASTLARELGCSVNTIRRDLAALDRAGRIRRVHGGAVSAGAVTIDPPPLVRRAEQERRAKARAAAAAVPLVPAGGMIFLGGGSTILELAVRLVELPKRTTFVTQTIDLAVMLAGDGRHDVHLTGGLIHAAARTAGGPDMLRFLDDRIFDVALLGANGIDADHGVMGPTPSHMAVAAMLQKRARRKIVVADRSKFGVDGGPYRLYGFETLDAIVTDRAPPAPFPERLAAAGVRLVVG